MTSVLKVRLQNKRKRPPRDKPAPTSLLKAGGAVDYVYNVVRVISGATTGTDGIAYHSVKLTYSPASLLSAPYMSSAARTRCQMLSGSYTCTISNLNNFPMRVRVWLIKPKLDMNWSPGGGSITYLIDQAWTASGGTAAAWENMFDFDIRQIPNVNSLVRIKHLGEAVLEPQTERQLYYNGHLGGYFTRARAQVLSGGTGSVEYNRQDLFLLLQVGSTIVSGSLSTGRANGTYILRSTWQDKWAVVSSSAPTFSSITPEPLALGDQTVFHRNYVTSGLAVSGNSTV